MDRYTEFVERHGSRRQVKRSLEILLPTSPIFNYLEGQIPHPAYSYIKIADIAEAEEKRKINREIGERRTMLGANIDQVVKDVKREVLQDSDLENLFTSIIDWTDDHETRRRYEEKLLQHVYDSLIISKQPQKKQLRERVLYLSQGLVVLKHPFALAWKIVIEWNDVKELRDLDHGLLTEYIDHFPEDGLSKVLRGYLECEICPFSKSANGGREYQEQKDDMTLMSPEDRLILMLEGIDESSNSTLSHRIMGEYFLYLSEYENTVMEARQAQKQLRLERATLGLDLRNISDAITIILATALVQYQSPLHHPEAKSHFENVLQHRPSDSSSLMGIGLILEEQGEYLEAIDFLNRSLELAPDVRIKAEVAWCKALIGDYDTCLYELESCLPDMQGTNTRVKSLKSQTLYRIGACLWERDTSKAARKDRNGAYARFLSSVQVDMSNAPAYTSLGIYYADYSKDHKRAQKCFQKAFELSASEVGAAERLATYFARSREWGLVEAVAQKIIESGSVNASGQLKKATSWPFSALGVVQLDRQDFTKSIVSFQSALRLSPSHFHSWVGLGESYHKSGRYMAATRAFEKAQQIAKKIGKESSDLVWFCNFMLANIKRELGEYEAALSGFREILDGHPTEFCIALALLQTIVESAWRSIEFGFYGRSVNLAIEGILVAKKILHLRKDAFDLWKSFADVCSVFSRIKSRANEIPVDTVRAILEFGADSVDYEPVSDLDGVSIEVLSMPDQVTSAIDFSLYAAILANKRSIHVTASDTHARSIAWYNLGWAEYRAHVSNVESTAPVIAEKTLRFLRTAVQCFKRAIEIEAGNSEFWNALGIATAALNPKVSQHSFVRSLYLNERSARVWTNLGALYLAQKDQQLANAAFSRAQSTDPDYAPAWLGQGILADQLGETEEAFTLFTHAFESTASSSTLIKQKYAVSAFDRILSRSPAGSILKPRLALQQLRCQHPNNLALQNISALYDERADDFSTAVQHLEKLCSSLEVVYEASELPITLAQFSQAKAELSRVQLAERNFVSAAENAQTTLDFTADEASPPIALRKQRLSAHMSAGLAYYYQGSMDSAILEFRSALEETEGDVEIICLLAKLLWTKGGKEERTVALDQLLSCVERSPGHFDATVILGAIAILEGKKDLIEAIFKDLQLLQTNEDLSFQQRRTINYLLNMRAVLHPAFSEVEDASRKSAATTAVMISPSQPYGWTQLAELNSVDAYPTEMALLAAANAVPPRGSLRAEDLCEAYAGTRRPADAQRAIMVAPWIIDGWAAFL